MSEQSDESEEFLREAPVDQDDPSHPQVRPRREPVDREPHEHWALLGDDEKPESALPRPTSMGGK